MFPAAIRIDESRREESDGVGKSSDPRSLTHELDVTAHEAEAPVSPFDGFLRGDRPPEPLFDLSELDRGLQLRR